NELKEMTRGDKSIVMTGYQSGSALRQLFAGAKLIAHPSESEGMSIVVLEAMSYGKTVLAADIPENKEALGNCGFYCRRNSLQDLEKKLTYLLKNPRVLKSMGARAQKRVRENFDWDKITEQVEDVYQTKDHAELAIAKT
ncbi:MAG: glycosyltransferase family 4 protein, partial [Patescibacteria group bacterium]